MSLCATSFLQLLFTGCSPRKARPRASTRIFVTELCRARQPRWYATSTNCVCTGIDFFAGVPDSLLKDFCGYAADHMRADKHIIAANEGGAVAVATGYHLATGKVPLVYLQNSGLGNTINPLLSLAAADVYSIPMLMLIGWRGEPGKRDEPQHNVQVPPFH
jgi:sulfopyruvate decarboxylase TPP-binding subunit